eukprot:4847369-Amphidinium_carterae.1
MRMFGDRFHPSVTVIYMTRFNPCAISVTFVVWPLPVQSHRSLPMLLWSTRTSQLPSKVDKQNNKVAAPSRPRGARAHIRGVQITSLSQTPQPKLHS